MNSYNCVIESEGLEDHIKDSSLEPSSFSMLNSKGLGGELVTSAALITISVATITAITKIIIALINKNKEVKITYKGKNIQFKVEGINEEKVKKMITELGQE